MSLPLFLVGLYSMSRALLGLRARQAGHRGSDRFSVPPHGKQPGSALESLHPAPAADFLVTAVILAAAFDGLPRLHGLSGILIALFMLVVGAAAVQALRAVARVRRMRETETDRFQARFGPARLTRPGVE